MKIVSKYMKMKNMIELFYMVWSGKIKMLQINLILNKYILLQIDKSWKNQYKLVKENSHSWNQSIINRNGII